MLTTKVPPYYSLYSGLLVLWGTSQKVGFRAQAFGFKETNPVLPGLSSENPFARFFDRIADVSLPADEAPAGATTH